MGPSGIGKEHGWVFTTIVAEGDGSLMLRVAPTRETAACPNCGILSRRRHSWYTRRPLDLPWRGPRCACACGAAAGSATNRVVHERSLPSDSRGCSDDLLAEPTTPPNCWWSLAYARAAKEGHGLPA